MNCQREMTLEEWCEKLPPFHGANRELKVLQHCRNNPFRWAVWDFLRKALPFVRWKSPIG